MSANARVVVEGGDLNTALHKLQHAMRGKQPLKRLAADTRRFRGKREQRRLDRRAAARKRRGD